MIFVAEPYRATLARLGFSGEKVFADPAIKPWRILADRENCTWDLPGDSGAVRLHVKRFPASVKPAKAARLEASGYDFLRGNGIPTAIVVAWGELDDGRSFIITEDLTGYRPADKLLGDGVQFDRLLNPTADLTASLHRAGLHHRDLYLCHFLAKCDSDQPIELRLIDAARIRPLPGPLTRRRWIVKDLAQFWYSTLDLPVTDAERDAWLNRYIAQAGAGNNFQRLRRSIVRKSNLIARHDKSLRQRQPMRNISIPAN